jgi:uncharacterized protein
VTFSAVLVILLFSMVQSVIGVGILLFGTPTLLLMGYNYQETLLMILPSSILISFLQAINSPKFLYDTKYIYIYTLPMVVFGLLFVTLSYDYINVKYIIGIMLILIGLIRSVPKIKQYLKALFIKHIVLYHILMGGVHGISNMGGGMLVVFMSTIHNNREIILTNIAYTYLLFGAVQMITLVLFSQESINLDAILLAIASMVVYMIVKIVIIKKVTDLKFNSLITLLIFVYGALSLINLG